VSVLVRALEAADLDALNRDLPSWSSGEYERRLGAGREDVVQVVAWDGPTPVGRGMVLFPGHEEYSASAAREGCAEVRDVFVATVHRRRGAARAIMTALEEATRANGMRRIGLSVGLDDAAAPARALYERLGYARAHGPFLTSATLEGDDGPIAVGAVLVYLVKAL
jgi:GNAT superfamily N-acetyltransferase